MIFDLAHQPLAYFDLKMSHQGHVDLLVA